MKKLNNVLIIDDDDVNNFLCSKIIRLAGFAENVTTCPGAREGLDLLESTLQNNPEKLPGAIFLDINMPLMNGWDFLDEYEGIHQRIQPKIPIFMLSSSVHNMDIQRAHEHQLVVDYISKPLSEEILQNIQKKY